ncbi:MAG: VOC family protein [Kiritimatiellae bacterium]|jgi:glyoxylase I family protein|nr:VOC family protein [Kiritimatiellia bacterium]
MIKGFAHVCIGSFDLKDTEDFYCRILGFKKKFDFINNGVLFGFYLDLGNGTFIEVFSEDNTEEAGCQMIRHICLEIDDIDAFIEDVRSKDWEVTDKEMGADQSWQCWITDPSGIRIEMHQYTTESSQKTGNNCVVNWG